MKIAIGSDHGGYLLKEQVKEYLLEKGYDVFDKGCFGLESVDYPVYAKEVAQSVQKNESDYGILICTTGVGMQITANKAKKVRAVIGFNNDVCMMSRKHNNCNVLCLGAKYTDINEAKAYIDIFLSTDFEGGRHERRVNQIEE